MPRSNATEIHRALIGVAASLAFLAASGAASVAQAQTNPQNQRFQYSAKFVCGVNPSFIDRVVPGVYATAINIHNPSNRKVRLFKKVALTYPPKEQRPGRISKFIEDRLGPDQALEVDCGELPPNGKEFVFSPPPPSTPYMKGYLVVFSNRSLDVTAVYTQATARRGPVSIDVEQIREREKGKFNN